MSHKGIEFAPVMLKMRYTEYLFIIYLNKLDNQEYLNM